MTSTPGQQPWRGAESVTYWENPLPAAAGYYSEHGWVYPAQTQSVIPTNRGR